jgi:hypothetical protein
MAKKEDKVELILDGLRERKRCPVCGDMMIKNSKGEWEHSDWKYE